MKVHLLVSELYIHRLWWWWYFNSHSIEKKISLLYNLL